ncbi:hypothetical protein FXW78_23970 [Rhodococcus opacus]|nr:hypothetical protein [Rhodococcus opacus]
MSDDLGRDRNPAPRPAINPAEGIRGGGGECTYPGGIDFNLAFQAFLHWLSVMFGLGGGVGIH